MVIQVTGASMLPTLHEGQRLLCDRRPDVDSLERGDLVVVADDDPTHGLAVKRLAGLPGDPFDIAGHVGAIPPSACAVMSDNLAVTGGDSRTFGPLPMRFLVGRVIGTLPSH